MARSAETHEQVTLRPPSDKEHPTPVRNISRRAGGLQYWMDTAFCAQSLRCWLRVILEVIFQVVKAPIEVVHSKCEETIPSEAPYTFAMYKYDKDEERETQQSHYPADYTKSW